MFLDIGYQELSTIAKSPAKMKKIIKWNLKQWLFIKKKIRPDHTEANIYRHYYNCCLRNEQQEWNNKNCIEKKKKEKKCNCNLSLIITIITTGLCFQEKNVLQYSWW